MMLKRGQQPCRRRAARQANQEYAAAVPALHMLVNKVSFACHFIIAAWIIT
jgi:hypothetical protein